MSPDELKRRFGEEYPAAIVFHGRRFPLASESRFARNYVEEETGNFHHVSRFMDGSASISLAELVEGWATWSESLRGNFCMGLGWLREHEDFPAILRFLMERGNADEWSAIALIIADCLPQEESFGFLTNRLRNHEGPGSANFVQAIAATGHPRAEGILRQHLGDLWAQPGLWADHPSMNWTAFDALGCIRHLLELEQAPGDFSDQVRLLAEHPSKGVRKACSCNLHEYYPWLPAPGPSRPGE